MSSEKTEYPTRKRLEDERKKGNIPYSKEFTNFIMILCYTAILFFYIPETFLKILLKFKTFYDLHLYPGENNAISIFINLTLNIYQEFLSIIILLLSLAIIANVIQTRFTLSFKSITPEIGKISIFKGLKRLFSTKALVDLAFAIIKIVFIGIIIFLVIKLD